jgi:hypothetical protein
MPERKEPFALPLGVERQDAGPPLLLLVVDAIRGRATETYSGLPVLREGQVAGPVSPPAYLLVAAGDSVDHHLGLAARLQVAVAIGEPDDGVGVPDVEKRGSARPG